MKQILSVLIVAMAIGLGWWLGGREPAPPARPSAPSSPRALPVSAATADAQGGDTGSALIGSVEESSAWVVPPPGGAPAPEAKPEASTIEPAPPGSEPSTLPPDGAATPHVPVLDDAGKAKLRARLDKLCGFAPTEASEKMCRAYDKRLRECGTITTPCDPPARALRPGIASAVATCLDSEPCGEDGAPPVDRCIERALEASPQSPPPGLCTKLTSLRKRCGLTYFEDEEGCAMSTSLLRPEAQTRLAACLEHPCDEVSDCLLSSTCGVVHTEPWLD